VGYLEQWQKAFLETVESLAPKSNDEVHRFWILFVSGDSYGDGAWFWLTSFRHLYILHLLVLSGSQVESISRLFRALFNAVPLMGFALYRARILKPLLSLFLIGFASATAWSAPITRATILGVMSLWFLRWRWSQVLLVAFGLQWFLFEDHRNEIGFYLSWIAYLVVVLMGRLRASRDVATVLISGILFLVVDTGYFENPFTVGSFFVCIAANLIFCKAFDFAFMPIAAVFILLALVWSFVSVVLSPENLLGGEFLALWTEPMTRALLVVLRWLMYT
jgi:general stress protein CsbA